MEEKETLPEHIFERYKRHFGKTHMPNIIRTKNVIKSGVDTLVSKNKLIWSFSIYNEGYIYLEGLVHWGSSQVYVYFKKLENENTYKLYIINDNLEHANPLLVGLNKFFTIDKI